MSEEVSVIIRQDFPHMLPMLGILHVAVMRCDCDWSVVCNFVEQRRERIIGDRYEKTDRGVYRLVGAVGRS